MYSISGSAGTAVFLSVTTESKTLSADVTSNAVESGGEVNRSSWTSPALSPKRAVWRWKRFRRPAVW